MVNVDKIKNILSQKKRELEVRLKTLTREDPFSDTERLRDNAASDAEASKEVGHERAEALKLEVSQNLAKVKKALSKIGIGKYGICDQCNKAIEEARLKIFPMADLCVSCEKKKESSKANPSSRNSSS